MKKTILLGLGLGMMMISLSSCGIMLQSNHIDDKVLNTAIAQNDLSTIISLNPTFERLYSQYANNDVKKRKIALFVADMVNNIERKEPGITTSILLMLNSNDKEMVALGIKTAASKFDEALMAYAGTLAPEQIFEKVFNEY